MGCRYFFRNGKIIFLIFVFLQVNVYSQKYPLSAEYLRALTNKTRDTLGVPGVKYFTNFAEYKIKAIFNPENGSITGTETIKYYNNSSDTLSQIVLRLYYNLLQKGNARDFAVDSRDVNDGVVIVKILIGKIEVNKEDLNYTGTNLIVNLKRKILPQSQIEIVVEWRSVVPQYTPIRTGRYPNANYMVAYWYPQIAVYDDVFGWDRRSHTGTQEFYNEQCNFDVEITVQSPYVVWATGKLVSLSDVFKDNIVNRIKKALMSDSVVSVLKPNDYLEGNILKDKKQNNFHFVAKQVPDFAFAVSKDHCWDAVGISMPDREERVLISAVYADSSQLFHSLANVSRKIISYFSFNQPRIYYPYNSMTVFEGNGGMEYPMMVNIGHTNEKEGFYYVVAHEIAHTYFPFYTGTNETVYAWMDEGFINFFPRLAVDNIFKTNTTQQIFNNYQRLAGTIYDLPIMTPTDIYHNFYLYRNIAYNKPAFALFTLYDYLGDSLFFGAIRNFVETWKYKHPLPVDFFACFETYTKQDFSWFFKPYFYEIRYPHYEISNIRQEGGLYFEVKNLGGIPQPISIIIEYENGQKQEYNKDVSYWKEKNILDIYINTSEKVKRIIFAKSKIVDIDSKNQSK